MSLFPAYAKEVNENESNEDKNKGTWLENSSFQIDLCLLETVEISKGDQSDKHNLTAENSVKTTISKIHKKKHKKLNTTTTDKEDKSCLNEPNEYFEIELKGHREYLTVNTISWPAAPKYKISYSLGSNNIKPHKKNKFKRYYQIRHKLEDEQLLTKQNIDKIGFTNKDGDFTGFKQEEELSRKTAYYNQHLTQYPNDIKIWLEYVQFQDTIYHFEKSYRKGSIAKAQRVLAERKLSILDKALSTNLDCELLHRERLKIAVSAFPADELQVQLKDLVEKDKGNIILWQGYIESTQCSMSHCNTPGVLHLYTKCLSTLHQLRRAATLEKHSLEESILKMLYQCGLFLKQAGLFEQLWTLLRMYLELNLSPNNKNKFNISSGFKEKQLVELEEVIFTSHLPLHELWLRTEKLRESCHWLPFLDGDECEDPQRLVFTEDVAELIHPITIPENIFKLTVTIFSLLKIPLLPCRHTTMQDLGLDYVPWSLDTSESLLSVFLPLYPVDIITKSLFNDSRLSVGPQYLRVLPGQEEYLQFVLLVMKYCSECLTGIDKVAVTIWLFRFQRLLVILDKLKRFKLAEQFKKQIRKNMKEFLKLDENRQNELYYLEYALMENELGNKESCLNIIKAALSMNMKTVETADWNDSHAPWCHIYRMLIQIMLTCERDQLTDQKVLLLICEMVLKRKLVTLASDTIQETNERLKMTTSQIIQQILPKLQPLHHFLPDFTTDWIICHGWFIYINYGATECIKFLEATCITLEENNKDPLWQKEVLYEFFVAILFKYATDEPACGVFKLLDKVLHTAIENYPNNLFLLSVLAKEQSLVYSVGPQWWRVQSLLLKPGRAFCSLFAVIILNQHIVHLQEKIMDTISGQTCDITINLKNRMLALFKKITNSDVSTRRCGLVWRLYLQFVYTYFSPEKCRSVYYSAVEECPWLKALYIDAAIYIPAELAQIQDLIIEKQLRLHVTPEELDVLRS